MASFDPLESLREALRVSPENVPLRQHLAETLLGQGLADEAETEYRRGLTMDPHNVGLKLGLATAFFRQGKDSEAAVVVEQLLKGRDVPAGAYLMQAKLHLRSGEIDRAVANYKAAIEADPTVSDRDFEERLGMTPDDLEDDEWTDIDPDERELVDGRLRQMADDLGSGPDLEMERPEDNFASVGGMEQLKEEIRLKIIYPLEQADLYAAYGKSVGGGILMYGPPGCGKTLLARATAGEIKAKFMAVGINDVLDMWIGSSERTLHDIFERARRQGPCVLFFDEVDALGARRSDMRQNAGRHLINQFLAEMDGVNANNDGLLILAATNAPWHLDPAFRRPGRFDRVLFVPPPDQEAREEILSILCRGKPTSEIDFRYLAKKTPKFSGADLRAVVDLAIEAKLQEAMKAGKVQPLTTKDLVKTSKRHRPTTSEWFATARNHALYANDGGIYDDVLAFLKM